MTSVRSTGSWLSVQRGLPRKGVTSRPQRAEWAPVRVGENHPGPVGPAGRAHDGCAQKRPGRWRCLPPGRSVINALAVGLGFYHSCAGRALHKPDTECPGGTAGVLAHGGRRLAMTHQPQEAWEEASRAKGAGHGRAGPPGAWE